MNIPCVQIPRDSVMESTLPDGRYAVIFPNPFRGRDDVVRNIFPWRITVYDFKDGEACPLGSGHNAGDILSRCDAEKVFLIGLTPADRVELNGTLARWSVGLVPELVVA